MGEGGATDNRLEGKEVSFAGMLSSLSRKEAQDLVTQSGGVVVSMPTENTSYLVIGQQSIPLREDGRIPHKLREARTLQERSQPITIINEDEFLSMMGEAPEIGHSLYTIGQLSRILDVPKSRIRTWVRHGLIEPVETVHRLAYFDFRQVSGARSLIELIHSGVSLSDLRQSLRQLETWMPGVDQPLSQLSILENNGQLLVRLSSGQLVETTGQLQFDFLSKPLGLDLDEEHEAFGDDGMNTNLSRVSHLRSVPENGVADPESNELLATTNGEGRLQRRIDGPSNSEERVVRESRKILAVGARMTEAARDDDGLEFQRTIPLPRTPRTADDWFEEALDHEDCGDLEQAARAYREALLHAGPQPEFCFNLANVLYGLGKKEAAVERYHQALEMDPKYVEAWNNLANVMTELGYWQEGLGAYRRALEIAPGYADAHYNLAETLDQLGRKRDADRHYQSYLSLDPHSTWAGFVRRRLLDSK